MVFSSLEFLFAYLPAVLILYFLTPLKWRNLTLFLVSLFFYGYGEPRLVAVMLASITTAYICGFFVEKYKGTKRSKRWMLASVIINLLILLFFKYFNFFAENLSLIFPAVQPIEGLTLPIGISFYTFQIMTYTVDLYRSDGNLQKNYAAFGAYVTLFPQLIAGPIVRYRDIDGQLRHRTHSVEKFSSGIKRFVTGLFKKIVLANGADYIFSVFTARAVGEPTVAGAWIAVIAFSFQIYFDFSGYSDMAIGLGRMLGFEFLENFNYPYISRSITEFWRRWHISLSTWFRDYVYIPLGGSRCGKVKTCRNIFIVWLLTGFWHGASWNYVIWGLYFFVLLMLEKVFLLKALEKLPRLFSHIYALFFIAIGWLIFVFEDISAGLSFFKNLFGVNTAAFITPQAAYEALRFAPFMIVLAFASTPLFKKLYEKYSDTLVFRILTPTVTAAALLLCVAYLADSGLNPFLYFRF